MTLPFGLCTHIQNRSDGYFSCYSLCVLIVAQGLVLTEKLQTLHAHGFSLTRYYTQ